MLSARLISAVYRGSAIRRRLSATALETLAAVDLLRNTLPDLTIRVINVVDLMTLQPKEQHPHGLSDHDFDSLFSRDKPAVIT